MQVEDSHGKKVLQFSQLPLCVMSQNKCKRSQEFLILFSLGIWKKKLCHTKNVCWLLKFY